MAVTPTAPPAHELTPDPVPRPQPVGRRSRKKLETRRRLMAAGDELFATRGFDETTTADIAELADVSQRTLFRHFATKEALLYGDTEDSRLLLREMLAKRPGSESALDAVVSSIIALYEARGDQRDRQLMQARLAASYPSVSAHSRAVVQATWEREIIAALADRLEVDPMVDPQPEIIAGAIMSAIRVATRQWTASGGDADFTDLARSTLASISTIHTA